MVWGTTSRKFFEVFTFLCLDFSHFGGYLLTNLFERSEACLEKIIIFSSQHGYFANI